MLVKRIVVLGNGAAGAEKQALALAARVQARLKLDGVVCAPIERVQISLRGVARFLPPTLHLLLADPLKDSAVVEPPLPSQLRRVDVEGDARSVVIGCGRATVALCAALKRDNPSGVFAVQIQHPRTPLTWFDAVVAPRHDFTGMWRRRQRAQALLTTGTVFDVSPALLERHRQHWAARLDELVGKRRTRVVWLVGGPCRGFRFSTEQAAVMATDVAAALAASNDIALLVTFSRRTPVEAQRTIREKLTARLPERLAMWDGTEADNPYYALLATATAVITTPDSVSMTTEAVATGKPVLTLLAEDCGGKIGCFHQGLRDAGCTQHWTPQALAETLAATRTPATSRFLEDELADVVDKIVARLNQHPPL